LVSDDTCQGGHLGECPGGTGEGDEGIQDAGRALEEGYGGVCYLDIEMTAVGRFEHVFVPRVGL